MEEVATRFNLFFVKGFRYTCEKEETNMFDKVVGHCQIRGCDVDILFVNLKKTKGKAGSKMPIRCQSSYECPRNTFCKFVNPLTNHMPVVLKNEAGNAAEAS